MKLKSFSGILFDKLNRNKSVHNVQTLNLWLTNKCNLNCYFCPVVTHSKAPKTELPLRVIEDFMEKARVLFPNLEVVTFSGGEPLLHSKFTRIVEYVKTRGYRIELFTNGTLLQNLEEIGMLKEFSLLHVSLHSISSYEKVFGTSNEESKEKVISCLRSLEKDIRKRTILSVAMTKSDMVNEVVEFAGNFGFKVDLFPIRNFKHAYHLASEIREDAIDPQIQQIIKKNRSVISHPCQHTMLKLMSAHKKNFSWSTPCTIPFESLTIDYEGNVRLCCGDQPPIGKAADIPEIFNNQISRRILFEANRRKGVCRNCYLGVDQCLKCLTSAQIVEYAKKRMNQIIKR